MNTYLLISNKFEGYIVYGYDKAGYLTHFENCSWSMNGEQKAAVINELRHGLSLTKFAEWVTNCGHRTVKLEHDLSFDRFWREYDMARNRIQAEKLWNGLSDVERQYTLYNLAAYKRYLKRHPWQNMMYPDTYLRTHRKDDWDKIEGKKTDKQ